MRCRTRRWSSRHDWPDCHRLCPNSRRASLVCRPMVALALNCSVRHWRRSKMHSKRLCSHLCRQHSTMIWHSPYCSCHHTVWCRRPLCLHRKVILVRNVTDANDDWRMGSFPAIVGSRDRQRWPLTDRGVRPMPCPCRRSGADGRKSHSVQSTSSCWREFLSCFYQTLGDAKIWF